MKNLLQLHLRPALLYYVFTYHYGYHKGRLKVRARNHSQALLNLQFKLIQMYGKGHQLKSYKQCS